MIVPETLDPRSYATTARAYVRLAADSPERARVREKLVRYLLAEAARAQAADEFDAAVDKLAQIALLYRPAELAKGLLPEMMPLATYLRARGERRGDEGKVLAALWIQKTLAPRNREAAEQYESLRRWSVEARQNLGGAVEQLSGLISVLEEHARLTPAPEVLSALADLYLTRRQKLTALLGPDGQLPAAPAELSLQDYREAHSAIARAPLDIAAVYLAHDDYAHAVERLRELDTVTGLEPQVRGFVEMVANGRAGASQALFVLARAYTDAEEPSVSERLCTYGLSTFPQDARFPRCLGQLGAARGDYAEAALDYQEAIALAPTERALYDEALEVLANMMSGELFNDTPADVRALAEQAGQILAEHKRRWPDAPTPVEPSELELAVGLAEMNAGNTDDAIRHLESSLQKSENTRTLVQLGQLRARLGDYAEAERVLERALERARTRSSDEVRQRAQILEQIGDVARARSQADHAQRAYTEALTLWEGLVGRLEEGPARAFAHIRRGVLLTRLARPDEATDAFELAMQSAPEHRETYAQVLAHLVVSEPNVELAEGVLRRAQRELTLEPEWKTYFALWVQAIAARQHAAAAPEAEQLLARLSRSPAWWGHLAEFGAGKIDPQKLDALASNRGERTEAAFYEGVRLMRLGNVPAARERFESVVASRMVGFYEFQMAQELLLLPAEQLGAAATK